MDHGVYRYLNITAAVHDNRGVARAYADGRFAGGVGCLHHAGTSGSQDHICSLHQLVRELDRRAFDAVDEPLRRPCLFCRLSYDTRRFSRTLLCSGMGAYQNRIAGFQADQCLKDRRGGRVRRRDDGSHQAHRLCDFLNPEGLVLLDNSTGFHALVRIVHIFGCVVIFDDLVLQHAHTGLFAGHPGKGDSLLIGCHGRLKEDAVHLLLGEGGEDFLGFAHGCHFFFQQFYVALGFGYLVHFCLFRHVKPPCLGFCSLFFYH